jgi:biotin carboxyl carrier protein
MKFEVQLHAGDAKKRRVVELERDGGGYRVVLDGERVNADAEQIAPNTISILLDGQSFEIHIAPAPDGTLKLQCGAHEFAAEVVDPRAWRGRRHGAVQAEGRQPVTAPMPGKVIHVLAKAGDNVEAGQGVVVVEAMKMQNEIRSTKKGKVASILANEGQTVNAGDILAWVE